MVYFSRNLECTRVLQYFLSRMNHPENLSYEIEGERERQREGTTWFSSEQDLTRLLSLSSSIDLIRAFFFSLT